jgi:hypothetical protein
MTSVHRWIGVVWPAALLLVFLGTFRRTSDEASAGQSAINCDDVHERTMERLERCLELGPRHVEIITAIYVVDAVPWTARDYAFDLSGAADTVPVTPALTSANRRLIDGQLRALASVYGYRP